MHQSRVTLSLALMLLVAMTATAQQNDTTAAKVNLRINDNEVSFSSELRALRQVAGAPETFYTYFWEFGDGTFSFKEQPRHIYKDTGLFQVRLFATNNYDDGKPPPTRPKPTRVNRTRPIYASNDNNSFFKQGGAIEMKVNRMPKPDEDMVLIMGYQNENTGTAMGGSLILFYNEKEFKAKSFNLEEERIYNNETRSSLSSVVAFAPGNEIMETNSFVHLSGPNSSVTGSAEKYPAGKFSELIAAKQKLFRQNNSWRFAGLQKGEERYFFLTLHTAPEMIKDTNAVVTLTGIFVPDDPNGEMEEYSLELAIVASHDPNRMMLKNRRLNYRFTGTKKEMQYRVRFQNTGKGPATNVTLGIAVPAVLDPRSTEILDHYPHCVPCDSAYAGQSCLDTLIRNDSILFVFKNIYLPGLRQEGFSDPDSTTGFVKYKMHFNKELKKLPFESRALIIFDRQPPVITNGSRGYFQPGNSPAILLGYNRPVANNNNPGDEEEDYFTIGVGISPYSPYKKYLQAEALLSYLKQPERFISSRIENKDTVINAVTYRILQRELYASSTIIKLELVPLQLRYNIVDWIGFGAGTAVSFNAYTRSKAREVLLLIQPPNPGQFIRQKTYNVTNWFTRFDLGLFGDIQLGTVRVGPALGLRFLHYFLFPQNRLIIYATLRL